MPKVFLQQKACRQLKKLKKKAKVRYEKILKCLDELSEDAENDSILLQDPIFYGLRRMKAKDDRIIFQICKECRSNPTIMRLRQCIDCEEIPANGIKVFEIQLRKDAYKTHNH